MSEVIKRVEVHSEVLGQSWVTAIVAAPDADDKGKTIYKDQRIIGYVVDHITWADTTNSCYQVETETGNITNIYTFPLSRVIQVEKVIESDND